MSAATTSAAARGPPARVRRLAHRVASRRRLCAVGVVLVVALWWLLPTEGNAPVASPTPTTIHGVFTGASEDPDLHPPEAEAHCPYPVKPRNFFAPVPAEAAAEQTPLTALRSILLTSGEDHPPIAAAFAALGHGRVLCLRPPGSPSELSDVQRHVAARVYNAISLLPRGTVFVLPSAGESDALACQPRQPTSSSLVSGPRHWYLTLHRSCDATLPPDSGGREFALTASLAEARGLTDSVALCRLRRVVSGGSPGAPPCPQDDVKLVPPVDPFSIPRDASDPSLDDEDPWLAAATVARELARVAPSDTSAPQLITVFSAIGDQDTAVVTSCARGDGYACEKATEADAGDANLAIVKAKIFDGMAAILYRGMLALPHGSLESFTREREASFLDRLTQRFPRLRFATPGVLYPDASTGVLHPREVPLPPPWAVVPPRDVPTKSAIAGGGGVRVVVPTRWSNLAQAIERVAQSAGRRLAVAASDDPMELWTSSVAFYDPSDVGGTWAFGSGSPVIVLRSTPTRALWFDRHLRNGTHALWFDSEDSVADAAVSLAFPGALRDRLIRGAEEAWSSYASPDAATRYVAQRVRCMEADPRRHGTDVDWRLGAVHRHRPSNKPS